MTATPAFLTLVAKARRRAVWNLVWEQASVGAAAALGCALLLLLLGTEILEWYWPVVLFFGGMAVAAWRTRRSLPSQYVVAQRVDERLNLADAISTAFHFHHDEAAARKSAAFVEAQKELAERTAASVALSEAMPWAMPKQLYIAGILFAVGAGLFLLRFGMFGTLDLKQPIVEAVADFFHPTQEVAARNKKGQGPKNDPMAIPIDRPDMIKQPEIDKAPEDVLNTVDVPDVNIPFEDKDNLKSRQSEVKAKAEEGGDEMAEGDERGDKSADGKDSNKDGGDGKGEGAEGKDQKGPQNAKQGNGNEPNSSMLDKMRDAMSNLLNKMKLPQTQQQQQQRASNQKGQEKGQQGEQGGQGQKGEKGQGQQQGKGTPTDDADADGKGDQQAQSGQGKSNDKTAESGTPTDAKSGMGKQDGSKDLKDAEQVAAMGKLSEIFGKRAQNMSGEVMVEVQNGKSQNLRTQYTQRNAAHREAGGEIHRDEVPLNYQHYVQQYFEQVRKGEKPVGVAPPAAPAAPAATPAPAK